MSTARRDFKYKSRATVISLCLRVPPPALRGLYLLGREGRHCSGPRWEWRDHRWGKDEDKRADGYQLLKVFSSLCPPCLLFSTAHSPVCDLFQFSVISLSSAHHFSPVLSQCITSTCRLNTLSLMRGKRVSHRTVVCGYNIHMSVLYCRQMNVNESQ